MKIKIYNLVHGLKAMVCIAVLTVALTGCKKDPEQTSGPGLDGATLKFVLNDNFNFGVVYGALSKTNLLDTLGKPGPYTFIAPANSAYALILINYPLTSYAFQLISPLTLRNQMQYYTLDGKIAFKSISLVQNKPYKTHTGGNIYVSRYLNGNDTVTTVNGLKVTSLDNPASNGLIQVLPQVMNPEVYLNSLSYLRSDTTLSLFSAAVQRAGLDVSLLQGNEVYTMLAPSNTAFQRSAKLGLNLGLSTLDSIVKADPVKLADFLKYHILKGRYFDGDLFRNAKADPTGMVTLATGKVVIGGTPGGFHTITFLGRGNKGIPSVIALDASYNSNPTLNNVNIPCGNAVVHIIDRVLVP